MMGRYSFCCSSSASFYFFCFMFFTPLVFCQLPANQRNTMMKLSQLVGIESWNTTASNPCLWKGVTCNSTNSNSTSISRLSLSGLGISGSDFLTILCQIDSLQFLDLSLNYLTSIPDGFIANCGKITGLTVLNFHGNRLGGYLPMFNGFSGLEVLDLSKNYLSGNIGSELDGLAGIKSLNLSMNNFTGFIPTKLGKSLVLEELQLSKNDFQGPIPEELFMNYQNLTLIDLSVNNLTGSVPITIKSLSKLEILLLSSNSLTGAIPKGLSSIQTLSRLAANQNRFTGTIPNGISRYVTSLDLSYNLLNGSLPDDLLSPPNVQYVDLSYNSLVGPIPRNISPNLDRLRLGSNFLNGRIPPAAFGSFLSLTYLELDNNSFSGNIPTELGSCKNLALLNLAQNKLTGSLPKELGSLKQLEVLKLQLNRLNGEIPPEFSQLSLLSTLNISGNSLSGSIPLELSSLQRLTYINLQDNKLTGSIPDLSGNSNLQELQLGTNCLTGQVVNLPSSLKFALNLSHNCFKGPIPDVLRRLDAIEILDLSNNNFTGKIPEFLTRIDTLTLLVLSNNQLSGPIPDFKPYVRVERSGNNDLFISKTTPQSNPTCTSTNKKISASLVIFVSIVTAVIATAIVAVVLFLVSRRFYRVNDENLRSEEEASLPQVIVGHIITTNCINKSEINFDSAMKAITNPKNIKLKSRFSTYYKAVMPCGTSYYVKKLNWSDKIFQSGNHEKFGQELEALGRLSNSSVMIPLAYVLSVDSAYVFYEYAKEGTLFDALHESLGHSLDWATRFNMAIGVAEGLAFLHGCNTGPILLLDLSTKSILLKSLKEPLIGDIELCKVIDPSKSTGSLSAVAGSVGYIPPEYAYTMRLTMPGNVYSFGVILLELVTGKPAVSNGTELAKWVLSNSTKREDWDRILDPTLSKTSLFVQNQMLSVLKIALGCIATVPVTRPTMKNVLRMLSNAR